MIRHETKPVSPHLQRATSPEECALAIALPLTREEFFAGLWDGSAGEFARLYCRSNQHLGSTEDIWRHFERTEVKTIERVCSRVKKAGVTVVTGCRLRDLRRLFESGWVVALAAHWREGLLDPDAIADRTGFLDTIWTSPAPAIANLRDRLNVLAPDDLNIYRRELNTSRGFAALIDAVNTVLCTIDLTTDEPFANPARRVYENRLLLSKAIPALEAGGGALELADGFRTAHEVTNTVPDSFRGVLDLMVCHSVILAETIRSKHDACRVLANRERTTPLLRILMFEKVIALLERKRANYALLMIEVRRALLSEVAK